MRPRYTFCETIFRHHIAARIIVTMKPSGSIAMYWHVARSNVSLLRTVGGGGVSRNVQANNYFASIRTAVSPFMYDKVVVFF